MKQLVRIVLVSTLLSSVLWVTVPARASAAVDDRCSTNIFLGLPAWYKYLDVTYNTATERCDVVGPQTRDTAGNLTFDWQQAAGRIALAVAEILLRIAGVFAVGIIIWGGYQYLISQGEPERVKNAKGTIINALVGLVIATLSVAIVNLIARNLI